MRGLLLDLDDTLIDERHAVRRAFAAFIETHRNRFPGISDGDLHTRWRETTLRHWMRFERGEISFEQQRRERLREFLGLYLSDSEADETFTPYRITYLASLRLVANTQEFLSRIAHLPRIVVTNGDRGLQQEKLMSTGLSGHLTAMVTPMDCGAWKPDPRIFLAAAECIGVEAADCAMIGDDEIRDIEPARRLRMQAFRVVADDPERTLLKALENLSL